MTNWPSYITIESGLHLQKLPRICYNPIIMLNWIRADAKDDVGSNETIMKNHVSGLVL